MALGLSHGGGDYLPTVKYNAKAGRWFRVADNGTSKEEIDITDAFAGIFDFENVKIGWISFEGGKPDFRMVDYGQNIGERPSDSHKQGAQIVVKLGASCGGEQHELTVVSGALLGAIDAIHTDFLRGDGKLPIVKHKGVTAQKTKHGTNYAPMLEIAGWASRAQFEGEAAAAPEPVKKAPPPPADNTRATADFAQEF